MTSDFLGRQVGDFNKLAYVVNYLIRVGRSMIPKKHLTSYVNAPIAPKL